MIVLHLRHFFCGVPQGYILGPLLFLIYITCDMSEVVECNLFVFPDESCLVCQHKDFNEI